MRILRNTIVVLLVFCLLQASAQSQPAAKLAPLPISEGLAALSFSGMPLALCPTDEQWIAFQLNDVRRFTPGVGKYADMTSTGVPSLGVGGDLWIANTKTGESRNLTRGLGSNWAPSWSPNGKYIAFYSDRDGSSGIWLWDKDADQLRKLSRARPRPFLYGYDTPNWTPDSRRILVKIFPDDATFERLRTDPKEQHGPATQVKVSVYHSTAEPARADTPAPARSDALTVEEIADFHADFALIDVIDGTTKRVSKGHTPGGYRLSPDGNTFAFLDAKGLGSSGPAFDLILVSLVDKKSIVLAPNVIQGSLGDRLTWSPDSTLVCYLSKGDWYFVSAGGGASRKVTETSHPPFRAWEQLPLWSKDGRWLYFSTSNSVWKVSISEGQAKEVAQLEGKRLQFVVANDKGGVWTTNAGQSLLVATRDDVTKQSGLYTIDLATGRASRLLEESSEIRRSSWTTGVSGGSVFYYVKQNADRAPDIWAMTTTNVTPWRITNINPVFGQYSMGQSQLVEWTSADGTRLRGALLLPAGYRKGQRYPLIVNIYGGFSLSDRVNLFGLGPANITNQQFWATRGYAVLLPDSPLRVGTPMLDLAKTILPGVDRVIEMGIADPDRLGVWGGSYGGYSTLALLVQTNRFKAAAVDSGFANLLALYGWMPERSNEPSWQDWAEMAQGRMGGSPWKYRERYLENSPVFYLDRVQTPVLIIQGAEDPSGKDFYSNEIFMNLRRLGKEATYLKYRDAGHTIASFKYVEQVDVMQRMLTWFDSHLKSPQHESR